MGACAGTPKRNDNESNCKRRKPFRRLFSTRRRDGASHKKLNETASCTTLYDFPLEILDIILEKSYFHWILNSPTKQRNEKVIRSLISVDVCFYQRITKRRFKQTIWRYLKAFYGKTRKRIAIIRNNRNYLLENIKLSNELISSLLSLDCITAKESHLILRQHSDQHRNEGLLNVMRSFDEERFSNCMNCFRRTKQNTVARIIESGGGVIKIQVRSCGETHTASLQTAILHQNIEDLRSRTKPWSEGNDKFISQLRKEGIEILNSQLDRQTVVIWIWCHSQVALEYMQTLYESNQLRDVFFDVIQPSTSMIVIDRHQFKKTVVECVISINFTRRIEIPTDKQDCVRGVTKLRNEIYILCASFSAKASVVRVFEDRGAFRLRKEIEIKDIEAPWDIGSSEKDNCLYVSDRLGNCIWKIARETDDEYKIIKWLTTDYTPYTLSVSSDGQLLVVDELSPILRIYGSDAEFIRSIQLPKDMGNPVHAVETSIGNFIVSHRWMTRKRKNENLWSRSSGREEIIDEKEDHKDKEEENELSSSSNWVSEVTSDGQMVVRRFIPSSEKPELGFPPYMSLHSDDQVFVADYDGVILLDSDLKWNRTLVLPKDKGCIFSIGNPERLCYNDENKQLIMAVSLQRRIAVEVYSVIRI